MLAYYDNQPSVLEAVGNGSFKYRFNIQEVVPEVTEEATEEATAQASAEGQATAQWQCEEVTVWSPLTSNKITEAVITAKYDNNYEQKLVNEYNAATLGLYGSKTSEEAKLRISAYTDYLTDRASLKAQVDADCAELGIE